MSSGRFQISRLRLRAPALNREQAHRLGERVAQRLADIPMNDIQGGKIPTLSVRVDSATGGSIERLAEKVANQIRQKLS